METLTQFLNRERDKRNSERAAAASIVLDSVTVSPDQAASDMQLATDYAKATGRPAPPLQLVEGNRPVFQSAIDKHRNSTFLRTAPKLSDWLRDPKNAAVARDDVEGLSWWEGFTRGTANTATRAGLRVSQGYNQYRFEQTAERAADRRRSFGEILDTERRTLGEGPEAVKVWPGLGEFASAFARYVDARYADLIGTDDEASSRQFFENMRASVQAIRDAPKSEIATAAERTAFVDGASLGETLANVGRTAISNPVGLLSWMLETTGESAPQLAAAAGVTIATRRPALGVVTGSAGSYATERFTAPADFFAEKGINLSDPGAAARVLSDPALIEEAAQRGVIRGMVVSAFDTLSLGLAGRSLGRSAFVDAIGQTLQQAVLGAAGEAAARQAAGQSMDWGDIIAEGLAGLASTPADLLAAGRSLGKGRERAAAAEQTRETIQTATQQAAASRTRARTPDAFRAFVARAAENGPAETMFVPAREFVEYFQDRGIDPYELAGELEGVDAEAMAAEVENGGDIAIPTATYAARLAGSEHDAFFIDHMRFDPEAMTAAEAREFNERSQDALDAAWEEAERSRQEEERYRSFEAEIFDTMTSRLRAAGRATDVATTEATLFPAFYRAMAERSGLTTEEFLQRYPLPEVRGDVPQGVRMRDVDALTRTLAEARSQRAVKADSRQSLLEWIADRGGINDAGGELRARDAVVLNQGRGRKALRLGREEGASAADGAKFGPDDVAQAAIEAGFLQGDERASAYRAALAEGREVPDIVPALWDAIDAELRGDRQFAEEMDGAVARSQEAGEVEAYLSALGVSLDDDDATIRAAIERDQARGGQAYEQFAGISAATADQGALDTAKGMEAEGRFPDEIFEATGFWRGADGAWRFEISDQDATLNMDGARVEDGVEVRSAPLAAVLRHPRLYEAYPSLRGLRAEVRVGPKEGGGSFSADDRLLKAGGATVEDARSVLLHEVAHAIQEIEGFGRGGNLSMGEIYEGAEVASLQASMKNLEAEATRAWRAFDAEKSPAARDALLKSADEKEELIGNHRRLLSKAAAREYYRRLSGEVEARNVQIRDRERQATGETDAPWWTQDVNDADQIIVLSERHGEAFAMAGDGQGADGGQAAPAGDAASLRSLVEFARSAARGITRKLGLGRVTPALAGLLKNAAGLDVSGYAHDIDANAVQHILKNHGDAAKERARGQIAITEADIAAIPDVLAAPDRIVTGAKNARGQTLVGYIKAQPDGTVLYLEEVRTGRRTLSAVSMRKHPATSDYSSIAETIGPNVRGDGGAGVKIIPVPADAKPLFQEARGSIVFPAAGVGRGRTVVNLFRSANLSTFVHESGHYFLTVLQDLAARGEPGAASDLDAMRQWWRDNAGDVARDAKRSGGVEVTGAEVEALISDGTTGDAAKDAAIGVGMQEQTARAFETYLMEGKAPSAALRSAFERFRAWLTAIYRRLVSLDVKPSPEVRAVFDRMLATDDELREAEAASGGDDLVFATAEQMGLDAEGFAALLKLRDQAKADAAARLLRETMAPLQRERETWFREEKARVAAEVEAETNRLRQYRAFEWMANRRWLGEAAPDGLGEMRLNKRALVERYGEGVLATLPRGQFTLYAVEGGVDPDYAAGVFGFESGDELVRMLERSPPRRETIRDETDRRMRERHGDVLRDGSAEQAALDAVHADKRGQFLAAELKALNDVAGTDLALSHREAREIARATLARAKVKDARAAGRYLGAERKAGEEAIRLAAAVARAGIWADAARRRVETRARGAVRDGDAAAVADPRRLGRAIDRANASAGRANDEVARLIEAKRRQLMNHMLYAEARKVDAEVEAALRKAATLNRSDKLQGKTRDIDHVRAARAIAAKFGLARPDASFDFSAWMEQLRFDDPGAADAMSDAISTYSNDARPYRELTVGEFRALQDALANVIETGKRYRTLEVQGQKVERDAAIAELTAVLQARGISENPALRAKLTGAQRMGRATLTMIAGLRRAEAWARDMDDGKAGPFTRYLVRPVFDAIGVYRGEKNRRLRELLAILEPRREALLSGSIAAPELGHTFQNKGQLLHAILHTGNESNLEKLLLGWGWSGGLTGRTQATTAKGAPRVDRKGNPIMTRGRVDTGRWDAFVSRMIAEGRLTKEDFDTAQAVWDLMEDMKRPAQSAHRKMFGFYFKEIEAKPFDTPFGRYRGGYVPAIADTDASNDGQIRTDQQAMDQQQSSFMFPTTGNGFTKSRVQNYRTPLALDLTLLPAHMDKVLRFTHLEPTIRQTYALFNQREMRTALDGFDRTIMPNLVMPWLQRTAQQAVEATPTTPAGRRVAAIFRGLRRRVGVGTMFLNVVNAAQQITGFSSAAVLVRPTRIKAALVRFAKGDAARMRAEAMSVSPYMRDRIEEGGRLIGQRIQEAVVKPTVAGEVRAWIDRHGYVMQTAAQNVIDVITWHAAYDQAVASGKEDADAVFEADSVIRRTMGDFAPENVSLFETGPAFVRLFTMFASYFNGQANLVGGEIQTAMRTMGWNGAKRAFWIYAFGIAIPAIVGEMIVQASRGELGDEDDDGYLDDVSSLFFGSQVRYVAGMVPLVGQATTAILNALNDKPYDDRLSTSPVVPALERVARAPGSIASAISGEGSARRATMDGIGALSTILGIPTGQLSKTLGYAVGVAEGYSEPEGPIDVMQGLVSGRDGTER